MISVHVPKTAGTSFREALAAEYGNDLAAVYDGARPDGRIFRAVHGHLSPDQFWSSGRHAKLIMWLRDPVERIASYYDFWRHTEPHGNPNHDHFLASDMTMEDFAAWSPIRDEFRDKYVARMQPDDFFFVGITERYEIDLTRLARRLGWRTLGEVSRVNLTPGKPTVIDDAARRRIEQTHAVEIDWYRRFV